MSTYRNFLFVHNNYKNKKLSKENNLPLSNLKNIDLIIIAFTLSNKIYNTIQVCVCLLKKKKIERKKEGVRQTTQTWRVPVNISRQDMLQDFEFWLRGREEIKYEIKQDPRD